MAAGTVDAGALPPGFTVDEPPPDTKKADEQQLPEGFTLDEHRTLGGALGEGLSNLPGSVVKNVKQMAEGVGKMVMHPIDTATTLGKLAVSITPLDNVLHMLTPAVAKMMGPEDANRFKAMLIDLDGPKQALIKDYVDAYGGGQNILKTIATDPARVLTDIATIASGGELAAASLPGKVGKVATTMAKAAQLGDPITLAAKGAGKLADYAGETAATVGGVRTGAGAEPIKTAYKIGREGTTQQAADFVGALRNGAEPADVVNIAKHGTQNIREIRAQEYRANKATWAESQQQLPFDAINAAEDSADASLHKTYGTQKHSVLSEADQKTWQGVKDKVDEWRQNPAAHTPEGLDDLKQAVRNQLSWTDKNRNLQRAVTELTQGITGTLSEHAPGWTKTMAGYSDMSKILDEVERNFSLGNRSQAATALNKLQKAMRNNAYSQQGGLSKSLDVLEGQGGVSLRPTLAGMALGTAEPRGAARFGSHMLMPGMGFALGHLPGAIAGEMVNRLMENPKLWGYGAYGVGKVAKQLGRVGRPISAAMSRPMRQLTDIYGRNIFPEDDQAPARSTRGYADGGSVEDDDDMPFPALRGAVNNNFGYISPVPKIRPVPLVQQQAPTPIPAEIATPPMPRQSSSGSTSSMMDPFTKMLEGQFGEKKKDPMDELREILKRTGTVPTGPVDYTNVAQPSGGNRITYDKTFGLPDSTPLPGSYEERVRAGESGGDDSAHNPSGASGRYQFMPATAEAIRRAHPELGISDNWRTSGADQDKLMKAYTDENREILRKSLNRDPTGGELYMMHMFGSGGGQRVLAGLDKPIAEITTAAERAGNPFLNSFRTGRDLLNYFNRRYGG